MQLKIKTNEPSQRHDRSGPTSPFLFPCPLRATARPSPDRHEVSQPPRENIRLTVKPSAREIHQNRFNSLNYARFSLVGAGAGAGSSSTGMVAESPSLSGMAIARAGSLLPSRYALILERS